VYFLNKNRELEEITGPPEACRYSKFEVCHWNTLNWVHTNSKKNSFTGQMIFMIYS
jgi:hypothetical protein